MTSTTSSRSKSLYHVRSVSLPTCPQLLTPQVEEQLSRLRSIKSASSSLSSLGDKLSILEEMYDSFDDILQLPHTQQTLTRNEKSIEDILDGYIRLLDLCSKVKDISMHTKQDVQELLSSLRRRSDTNEIGKYLASRKKAKKEIQKSQKDLKSIKHKKMENEALKSMFTDIEEASVEVFGSLLSYVYGSKSQSTLSGLVTKKYFGKSMSSKGEVSTENEFVKVDEELDSVINKKAEKNENALKFQNLQRQLTMMDCNIQDIEEGLECLFRRLIKSRVALLNVLNH